jgi:hypothetical protein
MPTVAAGRPTLVSPVRIGDWTGDKRSVSGGAALLAVKVSEQCTFFGDPVNVRCSVSHDAEVVRAKIEPANIARHDKKMFGLFGVAVRPYAVMHAPFSGQ